ncbi:MAG: flagellar hook-length control protein FliK [Rhodospirillales bacterium]|nr:flagellar hook-length control protein FliK [Rhodospirillales bacterium]
MTADRSRNPGLQGAPPDSEGNGFSGLLARLAGNRDDRQSAPAKDMRGGASDGSQIADWLRAQVEAAVQDEDVADSEPTAERHNGGSGGLMDIDVQALAQMLNGSGALTDAGALVAMAGRIANGTATEAETALVRAALTPQENGAALSPEQLIRASLEKAPGRTEDLSSEEIKASTAVLTVLRRETHLAPVNNLGTGWAARLATEGNRSLRAGTQKLEGGFGDVQQPQSAIGLERSEDAQLAIPQSAVAAARDGQLGANWRRGASPLAGAQVTTDILPDASEQPPAVQRGDALVGQAPTTPVTQQIAQRVAAEATTFATQAGRPDVPAFGVKLESPVKVLHIQLQPENLGVVTIRLAVKDNALRLDLEVGRGETASLIQRDRDALSALLRSAGYLIDGVEVRVADQSGLGAQSANGQTNTSMQGGAQSGSSQAEGRSPGERSHHERGNNASGNGRSSEDEQASRSARGGGIYI